jgi:hypothetical protein
LALIVAHGSEGVGGVDVQEIVFPLNVTVLPRYRVYSFRTAEGFEL